MASEETQVADEKSTNQQERRRKLHAALLLLMEDTAAHLRKITATLSAAGSAGLATWHNDAYSTLLNARVEAWVLGRRLAGDTAPQNEEDARVAKTTMADDATRLADFSNKIGNLDDRYVTDDGELDEEAVVARLGSYVPGIAGAANEAAVLTREKLFPDVLWNWVLDDGAQHCEDCPAWAGSGPYKTEDLPAYPRDGSSECGSHCECDLEADDGFRTFDLRSLVLTR